jgi:hypothetical protein
LKNIHQKIKTDQEVVLTGTFSTPASGTIQELSASGNHQQIHAPERTSETVIANNKKSGLLRLRMPRSEFDEKISGFSLEHDGDKREKAFFAAGLSRVFPNYETLWRLSVVPSTMRLENGSIYLRPGVDHRVKSMSQFHYSMMRSLLLAFGNVDSREDGSMQEFIMHLENALEQAELFLIFWTKLFVHPCPTEFRKLDFGNTDLENRKVRNKIINRQFSGKDWGQFRAIRNINQKVRDALLHGPLPLTATVYDQEWYPHFESIAKRNPWEHPQYWRNLTDRGGNIDLNVFTDPVPTKTKHFDDVVAALNEIWTPIINVTRYQFFTPTLLGSYFLELPY